MTITEYLKMEVQLHASVAKANARILPPAKKRPYTCFADFVHQHGREYVSAPISDEQRKYVLRCASAYGHRFQKQQCYFNAQMLLLFGNDTEHRLTYCEGYGWRYIPAMHGWLLLDGKHVIDTTWRFEKPVGRGPLANRVLGSWNDGRSYYGVTFSRDYVQRYVVERKHGGSLIDDPHGDWPLMKATVAQATWAA